VHSQAQRIEQNKRIAQEKLAAKKAAAAATATLTSAAAPAAVGGSAASIGELALLEEKSMDPSWVRQLQAEFKKPTFKALKAFLASEYSAGRKIFPPGNPACPLFDFFVFVFVSEPGPKQRQTSTAGRA